ncbi:recombinase family protein [Methylocystis rosea]|uniref:recombinase family protein n=1 Tax=Methylocystis rosea TaxID=173366 RepID=UPI00037CFFB5
MKTGYARVSTEDQTLALQLDALRSAGCKAVHEDRLSGVALNRPGLVAALAACQPGDVLHVWKLDRLGRSLGPAWWASIRQRCAGSSRRKGDAPRLLVLL